MIHQLQGSCFTRPAASQQNERLSSCNSQIETAQDLITPDAIRDFAKLNHRGGRLRTHPLSIPESRTRPQNTRTRGAFAFHVFSLRQSWAWKDLGEVLRVVEANRSPLARWL